MERKKAVVTGASRGIGKGIARCLAREGYDLAISYATQRGEAQTLSRELEEEYGGKCFFFQASLELPGRAGAAGKERGSPGRPGPAGEQRGGHAV